MSNKKILLKNVVLGKVYKMFDGFDYSDVDDNYVPYYFVIITKIGKKDNKNHSIHFEYYDLHAKQNINASAVEWLCLEEI